MRMLAVVVALGAAGLAAQPALAADNPQQNKMAMCNKEAGAKKMEGDARKAFMSQCLSADGGKKMKACETQADDKKLHGAARNSFVKKCAEG
jgi:hypothetical protein